MTKRKKLLRARDIVNDDATLVAREAWKNEHIYALEKEGIFGRNWLFLGHESQLKSAGDFVQAYMCETPVILSRGEDNRVYANVNSCSHRGVPVCRADHGNTKRFVCPYHNWSYSVDGKLLTIPQERELNHCPNKSHLSLKAIPRLESWRGFYFGCFDENVESLEDYLGDMKFYLGAFIDRFEGGIEFVGAPHRWVINANWKLPVENQLGDVNHGPYLHGTIITQEANDEILKQGFSVVPKSGHGATFRIMPEDTDPTQVAWGMESPVGIMAGENVHQYLLDSHAKACERVGPLRSRMKGLTYGVYPNLSFLWSNASFKVSHPRGPGKVEYWSWSVVPADAPDEVKKVLRANYSCLFGPGGILEQEDSEAWSQQFIGSNIDYMEDRPFYYGLGIGEEKSHSELPGKVDVTANEHYAREFYKRWRKDIEAVEEAV